MSARSLWLGAVIVLLLGLAGLAYVGYRTPPTERQIAEPPPSDLKRAATEPTPPAEPTPKGAAVGGRQTQPPVVEPAEVPAPTAPQPTEGREPTPTTEDVSPALADPPELRTERERPERGSTPGRGRSAAEATPGAAAPSRTHSASATPEEPGEGAPVAAYGEQPRNTATPRPPRGESTATAREDARPGADERSEGGTSSDAGATAAATPSNSRFDPPPERKPPPQVLMLPSASVITVGSSLSVSVVISSASDVGHVPFHVHFDSRVLQFDHGQEGGFLGSDGTQTAFFAAPTSQGDTVVVGLSRLGRVDGVDGAGELCVLYFTAIGPGNTTLSFARAKVRDSTNRIVPSVFTPTAIAVQ